MNERSGWLWLAGVVLVALVGFKLVGGGGPAAGTTPAAPPSAGVITISVASGITKREWMDAAVEAFNKASRTDAALQLDGQPIRVEILKEEGTHYRSGTQVSDTLGGKIKPTILSPADESWLKRLTREWKASHGGREIVTDLTPSVARTVVVVAMWQSRARALGCWPVPGPHCTWARLRALAKAPDGWGSLGHPAWGRFKFGYGYVGESDVGTQTAILLCMSGLGRTDALRVEDVEARSGCGRAIADVERAKVHSGKSSPWLLGWMQAGGPEYLDAVTTYEKEVIAFNQVHGPKLREPLVAAYPQDGMVASGHPLAILGGADWVTPRQAEAAKVFRSFLLSGAQQEALMRTGMRPASPATRLTAPIDTDHGVLPDASIRLVNLSDMLVFDRIVEVWHQTKKHVALVLVFDKSGSMQGEKLTAAIRGTREFVNAMDAQDWLMWLPFDDRAYPGARGLKSEVGEKLVNDITGTTAGAGTALYDAIVQAHGILQDRRKGSGDALRYGIVVLSDGQDTSSKEASLAKLEAMLRPSEGDPTAVQIHTIGIGNDADDRVLTTIARSAHGRYWKVRNPGDVIRVYRELVAYY